VTLLAAAQSMSRQAVLTAACATGTEERAARRAGYRTARVGIRASRGVPAGELVSFGVAGGLDGAPIGTVIDATRVVDERGAVLWEGAGLGLGRPGTILAIDRLIDDPAELRRLHEETGANAIDMESGVLAATGRLRGCVRAISDSPREPLGPVGRLVTPEGRFRAAGLAALARHPAAAARALVNIRRALRALSSASATGGSGSA
jgi:adenosylhomocysteine nucleosidase